MSEDLFPSGPWVGFYTYVPQDKHRMDLHLEFASGNIRGDGNDDVGRFLIIGRYDSATRECHWTKRYVGAHDVFYEGYREGKGIWGRWEIGAFAHGGFHIWPKNGGDDEGQTEAIEQTAPLEAIGKEEHISNISCRYLLSNQANRSRCFPNASHRNQMDLLHACSNNSL